MGIFGWGKKKKQEKQTEKQQVENKQTAQTPTKAASASTLGKPAPAKKQTAKAEKTTLANKAASASKKVSTASKTSEESMAAAKKQTKASQNKTPAKTSAPENKAKQAQKETAPKQKKAIYRVVYDKESRLWTIKKDGAKRTISSFVTKDEAMNRVKELSQTQDLSFVVHKKDGKFQKK